MRQVDVALDKLVVSALNARKDLHAGQEDSGIDELASSGLLSPPIVRPTSDGHFEVLVGQRRLLACRKIGLDPVPCLVRDDLWATPMPSPYRLSKTSTVQCTRSTRPTP